MSVNIPPWLMFVLEASLPMVMCIAVFGSSAVATNITYFSIALSAIVVTLVVFAPREMSLEFARVTKERKYAIVFDLASLFILVAGGWWWCVAGQTWQMFGTVYVDDLRKQLQRKEDVA